MSRSVYVAAVAVALLSCSSSVSPPDGGSAKCSASKDCPSGKFCVSGECKALPCGGQCNSDEICQNDNCVAADGFACAQNPAVCPTAFTCSAAGVCARSCSADTDCTQPGFTNCNVDLGTCGECSFDSDCTGAKKFCDPTTGMCVGCVDATSCGASSGKICDPSTHECVQGCHTADDCPVGERCEGGSSTTVGRCVQCDPATQAQDCLTSPDTVCDPDSHQCVECLSNNDCISTGQCNTTEHKCVQCVENDVCDKGQICDLASNSCVAGCVTGSASNCPTSAPVCDPNEGDNGTCVQCLHDLDCQRTQVCDEGAKTCVTGCVGESGTPDDSRCIYTGSGTPPTDVYCEGDIGPRGQCVECRNAQDCPSTETCDATKHVCHCKQTGDSCTANSDCGYDPSTGKCPPTGGVLGAACLAQIECVPNSSYTQISPICSQYGTGMKGNKNYSGPQWGCPSGYFTVDGKDVNGAPHAFCVPLSDCP